MSVDLPDLPGVRRVLVTGASGFVGRPLCKLLQADGHRVWVMGRRDYNGQDLPDGIEGVTVQSVGDPIPDDLRAWRPETVVHLAWSGIPDYGAECSVANLEDQLRFVDQVVGIESVRRVVGAGTCFEYGSRGGPCTEDEDAVPSSYVAWAKQSLRRYLLLATDDSPIDLVWFRIFFAYGPGQRNGGLLPLMLRAAASGLTPELRNPDGAKDFVYVDDVADAFRCAVDPGSPSGTFNLGSGRLASIRDVRDAAMRTIGGRHAGEADFRPVSAQVAERELYASLKQVSEVFGWRPSVPLGEGIRRTWYAMCEAGLARDGEGCTGG